MGEKEGFSFFAPGSVNSSVFNLMAATCGAGTITMPYIFSVSGIGLGTLLTIAGAFLSHYTGNLLVSLKLFKKSLMSYKNVQIKCVDLTGMRSYEDFAEVAF